MAHFKVYRHPKTMKLIIESEVSPQTNGYKLLGEFKADAMCDYLMNVIRINERTGNKDEYWTALAKQIKEEGI